MASGSVKMAKPVVEADINPQTPVYVTIADDGTRKLMAHEIKGMGCLVMSENSLVFVPQTTIIRLPDGQHKIGKR